MYDSVTAFTSVTNSPGSAPLIETLMISEPSLNSTFSSSSNQVSGSRCSRTSARFLTSSRLRAAFNTQRLLTDCACVRWYVVNSLVRSEESAVVIVVMRGRSAATRISANAVCLGDKNVHAARAAVPAIKTLRLAASSQRRRNALNNAPASGPDDSEAGGALKLPRPHWACTSDRFVRAAG